MKVGVILMLEGTDETAPRYPEIRAMARRAEAAGFDSIWIYDHLLFREEHGNKGQWECFTCLAALAEATERVELGTLVAATPFRNPALLAKIASALDEISGGRFTLGVGAGWNEAEFRAFDFPYDYRVDRFEEAVQIIGPLLREGRVDFRGQYYNAPDCENVPRRSAEHGPRLLIGANGPRMTRLAAQYAAGLNTGVNLDDPAPKHADIAAACAAVGRNPQALELSVPGWAAFPDLGDTPPHMREAVLGSAAEVADLMRKFERAGVQHVMFDFRPNNETALERMSKALGLYRA